VLNFISQVTEILQNKHLALIFREKNPYSYTLNLSIFGRNAVKSLRILHTKIMFYL